MIETSVDDNLAARISRKSAVVGILGLGYVGLPLALRFCESGFRVIGFDVDPGKCRSLRSRETYIKHIGKERVEKAVDTGRFEATDDFSRAGEADALLLCVPTPLGVHREPDMSYIESTVRSIEPHLRPGQLVSLESTTYPGTTEEFLVSMALRRGLEPGKDIFIVYSPEREDPGNPNFDTHSIPKLVGGWTPACLEAGLALYRSAIDNVIPVTSPAVAELAKLFENTFRSINIGLVNELKMICHRIGIDVWEVIDAAATKPFGFMKFSPGPGLGGHCIPIDPFYLTWKAREFGLHTQFIELAGEINSKMPEYVVSRVQAALNERSKPVKGARVLVIGVAYKKNVDDLRESPSLEIIAELEEMGAQVDYHDPYFPRLPKVRRHDLVRDSVTLSEEALGEYDCVIIATDHDCIDYDSILAKSPMIIDTRGRFRGSHSHVVGA